MVSRAWRRLRLGMVGRRAGAFIGAVHRIAARIDDRYELVAGALSSRPEKRQGVGAELRPRARSRSYGDFAGDGRAARREKDGIDAVAIVTPNHVHFRPPRPSWSRHPRHLRQAADHHPRRRAELARRSRRRACSCSPTTTPAIRWSGRRARWWQAGELGQIRVVQVEYPQDWLTTQLEDTGQKQADWRTDPARSGPAGSVGDIGTHAFNLAEFVTGLRGRKPRRRPPHLRPGRRLDDNARMLLRFAAGARACCGAARWRPATRTACASGSTARRRARMAQENPNYLHLRPPLGEPPRLIRRNGAAPTRLLAPRHAHPGRASGRLSRGLRPALHRCGRADRGREGQPPTPSAPRAPPRPRGRGGGPFSKGGGPPWSARAPWFIL